MFKVSQGRGNSATENLLLSHILFTREHSYWCMITKLQVAKIFGTSNSKAVGKRFGSNKFTCRHI